MTADMVLKQKSDGLILSDMIVGWTDWQPDYMQVEHRTQMGTYYPQSLGYANEVQELTLLVASHYPNATPDRYKAIWQAHRRNQTLTFRDSSGVTQDVRVLGAVTPDASERWTEVATKTITKRKITVMKLAWVV